MADALEARRQYRGNLDPRFDQFGTGAVRIGVSLRDGNADRDVFDVGCVRRIIGKPLSTSRM